MIATREPKIFVGSAAHTGFADPAHRQINHQKQKAPTPTFLPGADASLRYALKLSANPME
jgi:hypothetical protein